MGLCSSLSDSTNESPARGSFPGHALLEEHGLAYQFLFRLSCRGTGYPSVIGSYIDKKLRANTDAAQAKPVQQHLDM
jgi:hypothetical protein